MSTEPSPEQTDRLIEALTNNRKIAAIKIYRESTGADLASAKNAVESLDASLRASHPERFARPPQGSGCTITTSSALALLLLPPALLWCWLA